MTTPSGSWCRRSANSWPRRRKTSPNDGSASAANECETVQQRRSMRLVLSPTGGVHMRGKTLGILLTGVVLGLAVQLLIPQQRAEAQKPDKPAQWEYKVQFEP